MIVGYAFVVADLFHYGHLYFLRECKKYCDFLIVGVYTDELTMTYKRKPILPFEQRVELIKALKVVNKVVKVEHKDCTPMLKKLTEEGWKINFLFHGNDWKAVEGEKYIRSIGGVLVLIPIYKKEIYSTTYIINEVLKRYCKNEGSA